MKINWGHKIAGVYIVFVLAMVFLVYLCGQHHDDLVSTNYYEKELKYQQQIDMEVNAGALDKKLVINYDKTSKQVELKFPDDIRSDALTGGLTFFKPDNAELDFNSIIKVDEQNTQRIASAKLIRGWWRVKATWKYNDKSYYQEEKVFVE